MDIVKFKKLPVMGILRGIKADVVEPLVDSMVSAGLGTIEITMNTLQAEKLIKKMKKASGRRLSVGAGTVLNIEDLKKALDSGAEFIVSPVLVEEVVKYCRKKSVPVFPGAFSPQEVYNAWSQGATMVKVFPAKLFGPTYFKEIKGPFSDIELLACGGVNSENVGEFFACGACAVAFGASIFKPVWLKNKEFDFITEHLRRLIEQTKKTKKTEHRANI